MKNVLKNSVTCFAMFFLTVATALANDPSFKIAKTDNKIISLTVKDAASPVGVSFRDAEGVLLHSEKYNFKKKGIRYYNLKEVAAGTYYLEIETDVKVEKYIITVDSDAATIREDAEKVLYKPILVLKKDHIMITKCNLSKSDLKIKLYDKNDNCLYSEDVDASTDNLTIGRKLNVSELEEGRYTFFLTTEERTYIKSVNL
jgi:hypothetical protein